MTETEKKILRQLKSETAAELGGNLEDYCARYAYALRDTDPRMETYVRNVVSNPDGHNLYELLKLRRFFGMLDKYKWDAGKVRFQIKFYESLKFSGVTGRQSYKLTPVQTFQLANLYGLWNQDGRRVIRTAYLFVPRKFSKTTFAAFLAVSDMLFGDSNAEAYIGANSYDQAKKCFNEVRNIMFSLDSRQKHFRINRESVKFRNQERDSLVQCLTANAKTKDGLFASLAVLDEYAQARNTAGKNGADLKNVLTTSMGPRRNPLTVIITTASEVIDGPCYNEIEGVKAVLRGEVRNDSVFADLFMPDVDDEDGDPRTWAKVQPHLGVTVQKDFYAMEWDNAQLSAENMLAFRTKLLNRFVVNEELTWFTPEKAKDLTGHFDIDNVQGHPPCAVAFDLSVHDDFSAVTYTIQNSSGKYYCHTDYYFPEGSLERHPNQALYRIWHNAGHLKFCKGERIDVYQIANDILRRAEVLNIIRIGYDSYKAEDLVNIIYNTPRGADVLRPFRQTYGEFNKPVESFEMAAYDDPPSIVMNDNPINAYCLSNCVIDIDKNNNKKPVKAAHNRKIDGTITMLMTIGILNSLQF